eukprot:m.1075344 g.1075344  ORF g.1075344 m.1075344 type:complete len:199 (+) comp24239_c1_seq4:191-787(+)
MSSKMSAYERGGKPVAMDAKAQTEYETCMSRKDKACNKSAFVRFMLEHLERVGCRVDVAKHFVCEPCPMLGAFDAERNEVVLCQNNIVSERDMADVMTHELIHAFDHCRGKVDFKNLEHLACTEIRAANLSGDCFMWKEWFNRLNFGLKGQQAKCVRRKAARSIVAITDGDYDKAYEAIDKVWDTCYHNTEPFDRVPW